MYIIKLSVNIVLILFQFGSFYHSYLIAWGFLIPCWIIVVERDIFVFDLIAGRSFQFFEYNINWGACHMRSYYVEVCSFYPLFFSEFVTINGWWILSDSFSASVAMTVWFLFFLLLLWWIMLSICGCWTIFASLRKTYFVLLNVILLCVCLLGI